MQTIEGRPVARNPLLLAELYLSGLAKERWKTQKEALAALSHLRPSINRQDLSRAVSVSKLPPAVLSLFETAGIWSNTARFLVRLATKHGAQTLADRASSIDPHGLTWHQIIRLLDGQESAAPVRRRKSLTPLVLAAMYEKGVVEGRWSSKTAAAEVMGWHKVDLMRAVAISQLPAEVLKLFEEKTLVFAQGDVLLKIHEALGTVETVDRAKALLKEPKRRTAEQIVALLFGVKDDSGLTLKIRRDRSQRGARFVFEFSVDAPGVDDFIDAGEDLTPVVQMLVTMIQTRKAQNKK
ncbi:hypothetical protein [Caballeronia sp. J97]|uniref:hypothetical protein n=1 Tax=Caballeronia sp. J97 TaxID=2805429 RepID=UPI002AB03E7D|nr:hypothetical protein [Caballeronia sp. J97]